MKIAGQRSEVINLNLSVPYRKDHIPRNTPNNRRPGISLDWRYITIHNTGNPSSTAQNERGWLTNPSNNRTASFHLAIDANQVIEVIPLDEVAWHAGDGTGNRSSIGIEICESGDYDKNVRNAVDLTADLLLGKGLSINALRQHYHWSGKDCPWKIRRGHGGWDWDTFKNAVAERMITEMVSKYFKDIRHKWQADHVDSLREKGIISGRSEDTFDPDAPITRAECAVVVNKAIEYVKGGK